MQKISAHKVIIDMDSIFFLTVYNLCSVFRIKMIRSYIREIIIEYICAQLVIPHVVCHCCDSTILKLSPASNILTGNI